MFSVSEESTSCLHFGVWLVKVWGICRNGRASPIVCQRVDHPFAKWFCSSTATSFQSPSGPHTPRSSTGILSPQACFQVKSSLDDFAHVAELVGRQLAPWGEHAAGGGQVLEGLVRLQQTQVRVVQGMRRQLLRTLVVGDHKDDAGLNTKQINPQSFSAFLKVEMCYRAITAVILSFTTVLRHFGSLWTGWTLKCSATRKDLNSYSVVGASLIWYLCMFK